MTHRIAPFAAVLLACLFCTRCATVSFPTGGPKDERGPRLMEAIPESGTTNFPGKSIILRFDEWVKIDNPAQNVFTSPPLGNSVSYVARKNTLMVVFKEDLAPNTTYHINFGNSIKDVNEGNPLNNFHFVFATGDAIDSLQYQGRLAAINDAEINENTLIGLYPVDSLSADNDSVFAQERPFYFTFAEDNGNFLLDYLKAGTYRVYALTDRNNNYYYDLPNEGIGFLDSAIVLRENILLAEIPFFLPEPAEARVTAFTTKVSNYKIEYELAKSVPAADSLTIVALQDSLQVPVYHRISEDRKKINAWIGPEIENLKSIRTVFLWNGNVIDTFEHTISGLKKPNLEITIAPLELTSNDSLIVTLSNPIGRPCDKMALIDTLNDDTVALNTHKLTDFQLIARPDQALTENVVYTLLRTDSCLVDIYARYQKTPEVFLKYVPTEERGTLHISFEALDPTTDYIIRIRDETQKVVARRLIREEAAKISVANLRPGKYSLEVIEDANRNGVWNSGSLFPKRLPEQIYIHPKQFTLRANWEVEETIKLGAP